MLKFGLLTEMGKINIKINPNETLAKQRNIYIIHFYQSISLNIIIYYFCILFILFYFKILNIKRIIDK